MELTQIHNELNMTGFNGFTATELDLFFVLCTKAKNKSSRQLEFSFEELKELSSYKPTANKRFIQALDNTSNKLMNVIFRPKRNDDNAPIVKLVLFPTFVIDPAKLTVTVGVNEKFEYLLNALEGNFTIFELQEFIRLDGKYTKNIYRLLKQWRTIGKCVIDIDNFKQLVDIPKSYQMTNIDKKVLEPAFEEFKKNDLFKNLSIIKIKEGRGNKVVKLEFRFKPEPREVSPSLDSELPIVPLHNWLN